MKKKIRIILVSNAANSLFISSFLNQNTNRTIDNIFIYSSPTKTNYKNLNYKENEHLQLCILPYKKFLKNNNFLNYNFGKIISGYRSFFITSKSKIYSNEMHHEEIKFKNFLKKNKIQTSDIIEVYYGWSQLKYVLINILKSNVKYFKFEHGCGDVRETIESFNIYKKFYRKINFLIFKNLFYYNKINYCSIFYQNFSNLNPNKKIYKIKAISVKDIILKTKKSLKVKQQIKSNSMVIMIDYLDKNTLKNSSEKHTILIFFREMFNLIELNLKKKLNQSDIKNLIIKIKLHSDLKAHKAIVLQEAKKCFSNKYKVYFSDDLLVRNYNVEYLIDLFRVKIIVSSFSQGQINIKKIFPNVQTYMIETWYINFWKKINRKNLLHGDYSWLINFYFKKYKDFFKSVLPKRII